MTDKDSLRIIGTVATRLYNDRLKENPTINRWALDIVYFSSDQGDEFLKANNHTIDSYLKEVTTTIKTEPN